MASPSASRLLPSPPGPAPALPPLKQAPLPVLLPPPCLATPPQPPHIDPLLLGPLLPPGSPLGFPARSPSSDLPWSPASACQRPLAHSCSVPMPCLSSPGGPRAHAGVLVPWVGPGSGLPALLVPGPLLGALHPHSHPPRPTAVGPAPRASVTSANPSAPPQPHTSLLHPLAGYLSPAGTSKT